MILPEPLIPSYVDLRDYRFMPLEIARLRRSKAWLLAKKKPELGFYMINLWIASWHEIPAGSLDEDESLLSEISMCSPRKWKSIRDVILHGWVRCSDGRLYHPVVCEKALESFEKKKNQQNKTLAARLAKERKRMEALSQKGTVSSTEFVKETVTGADTQAPTETNRQGQGERQRKKDAADAASEGFTNGHHPDLSDQKTQLYDRGRQVFGENAGGLISQLLKAKGDNVAEARAALDLASTSGNAREYVGAIMRKRDPPAADPYKGAMV